MAHELPTTTVGALPFSYNTFLEWYRWMELHRWKPAETTIRRLLSEHLDQELSDFARKRIQISSSRIKDAARTWKKLGREDYISQLSCLDDIPKLVDDIVGVRIVCNNLTDIDYLASSIGGLPLAEEAPNAPLTVEQGKDRDYVRDPKPSGYRAYHMNLVTLVPDTTEMHATRVELQIRTRLQDSWGELTHEDTYKPEMELPPIVEPLARRMADLLAVIDSIAQDIRGELDRKMAELDRLVTAPQAPALPTEVVVASDPNLKIEPLYVPAEVLQGELQRMVNELTKPAPLAEIAQGIISLFGPEIAEDWGGFGTFKKLLTWAVPNANIVAVGPSYVAPGDLAIPDRYVVPAVRSIEESRTPEVVLRLRTIDSKIPTYSGIQLGHFLTAITEALSWPTWFALELTDTRVDLRTLNTLTRHIRDKAHEEGRHVPRQNLDWALKSFLWSGNLRPGISEEEVIDLLARWIVSRAASQAIPIDPPHTEDEVRAWLSEGLAAASEE